MTRKMKTESKETSGEESAVETEQAAATVAESEDVAPRQTPAKVGRRSLRVDADGLVYHASRLRAYLNQAGYDRDTIVSQVLCLLIETFEEPETERLVEGLGNATISVRERLYAAIRKWAEQPELSFRDCMELVLNDFEEILGHALPRE